MKLFYTARELPNLVKINTSLRRDLETENQQGKLIKVYQITLKMEYYRSVHETYQNVHDDEVHNDNQLAQGVNTEQQDQGEFGHSDEGYDPTQPGDEHVNVHSMR